MKNFRHIVPALRLHHGADALSQLGREVLRLDAARVVVLCGATLAQDGHAMDLVRNALGDRCAAVLPIVRAHSPLPDVEAAAHELQRLHADAVVALGGGSAIVTARAASILLAEGGDARRLCTSRDAHGVLRSPRLGAPKLPQIVLPTTPTTAIVKAGSAMLDPVDGNRLALFDPRTRAQAVFIDPYLIGTPPRALVVSASLNTLTMAIEGLCSRSGDPMADASLIHALRMLMRGLRELARADSPELRSELMIAALLCGHGTDYTGAGIALPLGHALSARFHLDNGIANAILIAHVLRFNAVAAGAGLEKIAIGLGLSDADAATRARRLDAALRTLFEELAVPQRLRDVGVTQESLPEIAAISMDDWFVRDNPRPVQGPAELEQLLREAW